MNEKQPQNEEGKRTQNLQNLFLESEKKNSVKTLLRNAQNNGLAFRNCLRHKHQMVSPIKSTQRITQEVDLRTSQMQPPLYTSQPKLIVGGSLKPYQIDGLNWMISLYEYSLNGILSDEMGLGKSVQTISFIAYLKETKNISGPHLVIAPKSTILSWVRELEKWLPSCRVAKILGRRQQNIKILLEEINKGLSDVIVTSLQQNEFLQTLGKIEWQFIIIDESHLLKNSKSSIRVLSAQLSSPFKVLLSGSPLPSNLDELLDLFYFVLSNKLSVKQLMFQEISKNQFIQELPKLKQILSLFVLRRTRKDIEDKQIPLSRQQYLFPKLTERQINLYKKVLIEQTCGKQGQKNVYNNIIMQLRKVCNHPYLVEGSQRSSELQENVIYSSGKFIVLDLLLSKLIKHNKKILILTQMTRCLDLLEDYCSYRKFQYCRVDGSTRLQQRQHQVQRFSQENVSIFLLTTRCSSHSCNLSVADTVILLDSDWNRQIEEQAIGLVNCAGQTQQVHIFRLICENTIEEKIIETQILEKTRFLELGSGTVINKEFSCIQSQLKRTFQLSKTKEDLTEMIVNGEKKMNNFKLKSKVEEKSIIAEPKEIQPILKSKIMEKEFDQGIFNNCQKTTIDL